MASIAKWFGQRRKYFDAAIAPALPVAAHYLNVGPHVPSGYVWYSFLVLEAAALGVHALTNDPKPEPEPTATPPTVTFLQTSSAPGGNLVLPPAEPPAA